MAKTELPQQRKQEAACPEVLAFLTALFVVMAVIPALIYGIGITTAFLNFYRYSLNAERYERLARTGPQGHKLTLSPLASIEAVGADLRLCPEDFADCARVVGAAEVVDRIAPGDRVVIFGDLEAAGERVPGERYTHVFAAASIKLGRQDAVIFDSLP